MARGRAVKRRSAAFEVAAHEVDDGLDALGLEDVAGALERHELDAQRLGEGSGNVLAQLYTDQYTLGP